MINWESLKQRIVHDTVGVVNGLLYDGLARAQKDVPVRRIFQGDKQTVRFKTASEIEKDRDLRSRLGLAPEILGSAKAVAAVRAAGLNPRAGRLMRGKSGKSAVYGFARTVKRRDRANSWAETGALFNPETERWEGRRVLNKTERQLAHRDDESFLTAKGKYELESGRAVASQRILGGKRKPIGVDLSTGKIQYAGGDALGGTPTVGGGLRSTLRVDEAHDNQYPVIEGWLLAGDREHDYAKYQELGTRHNAAHPYLRPRLIEWKALLPVRLKRSLGRYGQ